MIAHGIVVNGDVLPGTERVIRDSDAWWEAGALGTRPRGGRKASWLVLHWTGGRPRTGPLAGPKVVRAMKARKRKDGSPMDVGIHFVVSFDGIIWQTADLGIGTVHVGHRAINAGSVGVECCWPGTAKQAAKLGVELSGWGTEVGTARGQRVHCMRPSAELVDAVRWLYDALTMASHHALEIPRKRGRVDRHGVMEHCDVPGGTKVDAAGLLVAALGVR